MKDEISQCLNLIIRQQNIFTGFLSNRNKEKKIKLEKPVNRGLPILEISKTLMFKFCYDYIKPTYQAKVKLCYMDADSFIINIKV